MRIFPFPVTGSTVRIVMAGSLFALAFWANRLFADHPSPNEAANERYGHSQHGEAFDEGPRQAAYQMAGLGTSPFPVTTASTEAQVFVTQGVAQLHGFWYWEAERSFRQAAALDPDCAMAYWGMAMANVNNEKRALAFIKSAVSRQSKCSPREQQYIALTEKFLKAGEKSSEASSRDSNADKPPKNNSGKGDNKESNKKKDDDKKRHQDRLEDWEQLVQDFPEDTQAKAFLAYEIWHSRDKVSISSFQAVDSIIELVLQKEPMHPAHHYRIHLWDEKKAKRALTSAALCGQATPGIAHMWHMPGHTYSKLHRYVDAVYQQQASARVDHAYMMRDGVFPYEIHNYAHNQEWCIRNLVAIGKAYEAVGLAQNMIEIPQHPKKNVLKTKNSAAALGRKRLFETLMNFELWREMVLLADSPCAWDDETDPGEEFVRKQYLAFACAQLAQTERANSLLQELKQEQTRWEQALDAPADASLPHHQTTKLSPVRFDENELKRIARLAKDAVKLVSIGTALAKPDAAEAYRLAEGFDLIPKTLSIRWQHQAGKVEEALKRAKSLVQSNSNEVLPLALLVELQHNSNQIEEAQKSFQKLQTVAAFADVSLPAFTRLKPFLRQHQHLSDWRTPPAPATDVGIRPDLTTLGPLTWSPQSAPEWDLPSSEGKRLTRTKSKPQQPVIVMFYLGVGCLHCAEQLQAFAPLSREFREAGISLVAIGTDPVDKLDDAIRRFGEQFPIPLAADPEATIFKKYRCFDDFENKPLHGTFLIDAEGKIRWQDLGAEPFQNAEFLLRESRRLLALSHVPEIKPAPLPETKTTPQVVSRIPPAEEFHIIPVKGVRLQSSLLPAAHSRLTEDDLERIFSKVNQIWSPAGIYFGLQTVETAEADIVSWRHKLRNEAEQKYAREAQREIPSALFPVNRDPALLSWSEKITIANVSALLPANQRASFDGITVNYLQDFDVNGVFLGRRLAVVKDRARLREVPGGIDEPIPRVTAHELGHALGLVHRQENTNLMASGTTGTQLNQAEIDLARSTAQKIPGRISFAQLEERCQSKHPQEELHQKWHREILNLIQSRIE